MKKYYMSKQENSMYLDHQLIIAGEDDIMEVVEMAGMAYVHKNNIENIKKYAVEFDGEGNLELVEARNYLFLAESDLTADEQTYLANGNWIWLTEMEKYEDVDLDEYTKDEIEELEKKEEKALAKSIIGKMKTKSIEADDLETYKIYGYHDGSNWKEIILDCYHNVYYTDITEDLENMKQIDYERYDTGDKTLYELTNGKKIVIDNSYYQGTLWGITFVDKNIETIEDARKWIDKKEMAE